MCFAFSLSLHRLSSSPAEAVFGHLFFLFAFSPPGPFMERKLPFEALAIESVSWEHSKQERPTGQLGTENF